MSDPDFSTNYTRALRRAVKGDRRDLARSLRAGVSLTRADMAMLADYIEGKFRPKGLKPAHRPRLTYLDLITSDKPMHKAIVHYWEKAGKLTSTGKAYGNLAALNDAVASFYGVEANALKSARERHRKLNPHYTSSKDRRKDD